MRVTNSPSATRNINVFCDPAPAPQPQAVPLANWSIENIQFLTGELKSGAGNSGVATIVGASRLAFELNVNAVSSRDVAVDVAIQTRIRDSDEGWFDVVHFPVIRGSEAPRLVAVVLSDAASRNQFFEIADALPSGSIRPMLGTKWRVRWAITGGEAGFSVVAGAAT